MFVSVRVCARVPIYVYIHTALCVYVYVRISTLLAWVLGRKSALDIGGLHAISVYHLFLSDLSGIMSLAL